MLFFLALSILGFALCVLLHVLTYTGYAGDQLESAAAVLFLGAFPTFIAAMATSAAGPGGTGDRFTFDNLRKASPTWLRRCVAIVIAYAALNFASFAFMEKGTPTREPNGTLSLRSKGRRVQTITPEEFRWHQGLQARGMSGHPLAFYAIAAMVFWGARNERRRHAIEAPSPSGSGISAAALLDYGRSSPRLAIWVHLMLFVGSIMIAWIGTPAVVAGLLSRSVPRVPPPIAVVGFLGGALGGVALVNYLFRCVIPARCPNCRGRAYCVSISRPTRYVCRDCGYEHRTT